LKQAVASLWCLVFLGGIGTRARRGGGNLKVKQVKGNLELLDGIEFEINQEFEKWFKDNLEKIKKVINSTNSTVNYTSISQGEVYVFNSQPSWIKALEVIGSHFRNFRYKRQPDYSTVKQYLLSGGFTQRIEKVEFGIPLSFRYRSLNNKSAIIEGANKERQRSTSPLIFKVIENKGRFYPLIILLNKPYLLAKGDRLVIRDVSKQQNSKIFSCQYTGIVKKFLSSLKGCRRISL